VGSIARTSRDIKPTPGVTPPPGAAAPASASAHVGAVAVTSTSRNSRCASTSGRRVSWTGPNVSTLSPSTTFTAPIRGDLAGLFIAHKAELGLADRADAEIKTRIDDIIWHLWQRVALAVHGGDDIFLQRFGWLIGAFQRLDAGECVAPLDG
jgi:hypothetical protein